jgi:hypothetical protein
MGIDLRAAMNDQWPPPGRTIIGSAYGTAYAGPCLVIENVRSWEWESFERRSPRPARERLGPLQLIEDKK